MRRAPEQCQTMLDVRAGVDELDRELVALLAERFRFMDAAARIKTDRSLVRDEPRKKQVIDNAVAEAAKYDLNSQIIADLWDHLVESSIAHELAKWDRIRTAN